MKVQGKVKGDCDLNKFRESDVIHKHEKEKANAIFET